MKRESGKFSEKDGNRGFCPATGNGVADGQKEFRPRSFPTNSREKVAANRAGPLIGAGIDKLAVSFPLTGYDANHHIWTSREEKPRMMSSNGLGVVEGASGNVYPVQGVPVWVSVSVWRDANGGLTPYGYISFNPSRVNDPKGYGLASVQETLDAFSTVLTKLEDCLAAEDMDDLSIYKVTRIDVARDFHGVQSPAATIRGLAPLHRNYSKKCVLYSKSSSNYAETLEVGAKSSGYVRLYDKYVQTKRAVELGTLRWEVEAYKEWARQYGGLRTLEDLATIGVDDLARNRWEWSGMGNEVASVGGSGTCCRQWQVYGPGGNALCGLVGSAGNAVSLVSRLGNVV